MATLSELVKFKNDLSELTDQLSLNDAIVEKINLFNSLNLKNENAGYDQLIQQHIDSYQEIVFKNNNIIEAVKSSINIIDNDINQMVNSIDNRNRNEENMFFLLPGNEEVEKIIQSRIGISSDWHFPGLQICRYATENSWQVSANLQQFTTAKTRIDSMVACDPLYITSNSIDALNHIIAPFPEAYQRRLRLYEINNRKFNELPQAQFGLILCWDYFNYLPLDIIEIYLKEIIKLLRPGGRLLFSYNNGEIVSSARLVEEDKACWATAKLLKNMVISLGYEFVVAEDFPINDIFQTWISWIEVCKPGQLTTIKRAQAMGAVLSK